MDDTIKSRNPWWIQMNQLGKRHEPFVFILDFELNNPLIIPVSQLAAWPIRICIPNFSFNNIESVNSYRPIIRKFPVPFKTYQNAFDIVMAHLQRGDTYLTNLTFPTPVELSHSLEDFYTSARAPYKLLMKDRFLVYSPEVFVLIKEGRIFSYPMKGTIQSDLPNAGELLLNNAKEAAEHATIVDLIRNDLSLFATNVSVTRYRYLELIPNQEGGLIQASSEICGLLEDNYCARLGDYFKLLLPAGSISGAPKHRTLSIIQEAERIPRGYYTGVFGYFDGNNLESAVMIRFIEKTSRGFLYRSGGGITSQSKAEDEYQELIHKVYVPLA